jgi:hypothetical protein
MKYKCFIFYKYKSIKKDLNKITETKKLVKINK